MVNLVLVEPEIPSNTGNIARTAAATGSILHLVKPLGFDISDKAVKRAGLATTKAPRYYCDAKFTDGAYILFGKETAGLPLALRERYRDRCIRLPMISEARSLNLGNSAAILCYEALRQQGFPNLLRVGEMANQK